MAGADVSKLRLKLEEIFVPDYMQNGNKFLKWDEDSSQATPVTLKVDTHGHFLYWKYQNKDVECLELTQVRDTRTGKYASTPKDAKLRDVCNMGNKDESLESKTITVIYGADFVNLTFVNFCATSAKTAEDWCGHLLKLGHHSSSLNPSPAKQLHKIYTKMTLMVNREGHIPVKNIYRMFISEEAFEDFTNSSEEESSFRKILDIRKMFSSARADSKKVETALQVAGVHSGKDDTMDPKRFTYDVFFTFFMRLVNQKEVDTLFQEMGAKNKPYLTTDQIVKFLNNHQRDPRLNEILYPFYDAKAASAIIEKFEKNKQFARKGHMSIEGLIRYLLSDENQIDVMESYMLSQDMEQPLAHYFIKSSHNTYLTGHQFTGKSTVEIYRQVLLSGCRCVELDCWDRKGDADEPIITHGYTMCTDVLFKDVIEAINESAFKTSDYPVILSFENHCNQKNQAKMAHYCRTIFGDKLLVDPLSEYPIESSKPLPPPSELINKILVKNKKRKQSDATKKQQRAAGRRQMSVTSQQSLDSGDTVSSNERTPIRGGKSSKSLDEPTENGDGREGSMPATPEVKSKVLRSEEKSTEADTEASEVANDSKISDTLDDVEEESDDSDDEEGLSKEEALKKMQEMKDRGTAGKEAEAGAEMSALVNYIQPVHFSSFETSDKKDRSYEISSFVETSALSRVKENPVEFVNYNKRQLSRIYPKGSRLDSSNFMPQIFWNCGCQLVALNYQNMDLPMQLNLGLFNQNGRTGYILKPDFMRRKDRIFDPFSESTMDGIVAATVKVRVMSGHFLSDKKVGTYIEVDMFGLPADTVRKKYKTKTISNTTINPQFDDEGFVFEKVIMPKLATLRITAYDDSNRPIGHRILPVDTLRPGYRHIPLCNELYQPLLMPSVFVHIEVGDYVPKGFANFADALVNPVQHVKKLDEEIRKREQALSKLVEDTEEGQGQDSEDSPAPLKPTPSGDAPTPKVDSQKNEDKLNTSASAQPSVPLEAKMSTDSPGTSALAPAADPEKGPSNKGVNDMKQDLEKRDSFEALPQKKTSKPSRPSVMAKESVGSSASGTGIVRSVSMGNSQFESNALQGFNNQSKRSKSTPNLAKQEEIVAATIDEVKQEKRYQKVMSRLDTELQKLVKRHEKKHSKLKKRQAKELNKYKSSQEKARKKKEKKTQSDQKKAMKSNKGSAEDVKRQFSKSMEALQQEQEKELMKKQVSQEDILIDMYHKHLMGEKELAKEHAEILFELQMDLMTTVHEKQLKKLDAQHKKVEQDLRKMLEAKNIEEMKSISKSKREKNEISRLKREARNKHIEQAVTERTRLIQLHEKKKSALKENMKELQQALSENEESMLKDIEKDYKARSDQLLKERKFSPPSTDTNGTTSGIANAKDQVGANGDAKKATGDITGPNGIAEAPREDNNKMSVGGSPAKRSNGDIASSALAASGTSGSSSNGSAGNVTGVVEVHASINGETNTNNSAQTHLNEETKVISIESPQPQTDKSNDKSADVSHNAQREIEANASDAAESRLGIDAESVNPELSNIDSNVQSKEDAVPADPTIASDSTANNSVELHENDATDESTQSPTNVEAEMSSSNAAKTGAPEMGTNENGSENSLHIKDTVEIAENLESSEPNEGILDSAVEENKSRESSPVLPEASENSVGPQNDSSAKPAVSNHVEVVSKDSETGERSKVAREIGEMSKVNAAVDELSKTVESPAKMNGSAPRITAVVESTKL